MSGGNRTLLIAERDGWICNGCGEVCVPWDIDQPTGTRYATTDHRDPNGGNGLANLWLMCSSCNSSKGKQTLQDWEKTLAFDGEFLRRGFTQIPNTLLYDTTVSMGARMTLICLMQFAWKGDPFPGQLRLGSMLGVSDRTVRDYLTELKGAGYLKVYRRGRGKTNVYRIVQLKLVSVGGRWTEDPSGQVNGDRNQSSGLERNQSSGEEYEVEEDEEKPFAAAPRKRNEVWDALSEIFGEPTTRTAQSGRGKVCASLTAAGATPDEIFARAKRWALHFDHATLTDHALEKHWHTLPLKPRRIPR